MCCSCTYGERAPVLVLWCPDLILFQVASQRKVSDPLVGNALPGEVFRVTACPHADTGRIDGETDELRR